LGSCLQISNDQELNIGFKGSMDKAHKSKDCRQACISASGFEDDDLQVESSDILFDKEGWNVVIFRQL